MCGVVTVEVLALIFRLNIIFQDGINGSVKVPPLHKPQAVYSFHEP
jgi:hypothetical protein